MENVFNIFTAAGLSSFALIFIIFIFLFYFLMFGIGVTIFVFWIIALVDVAKRKDDEFPSGGENIRVVWILLLIFIWVSSVPYYFLVIKNKTKTAKETGEKKIETK